MQAPPKQQTAGYESTIVLNLNTLQSIVPLQEISSTLPGTVIRLSARVVTSTVTRRISWELLAWYEGMFEPEVWVSDYFETHPGYSVWGSTMPQPNLVSGARNTEIISGSIMEGRMVGLPKTLLQVLSLDGVSIYAEKLLKHISIVRGVGYRLNMKLQSVDTQEYLKYPVTSRAKLSRLINAPFRDLPPEANRRINTPFMCFTFPEDTTQQTGHGDRRIIPTAEGVMGFGEAVGRGGGELKILSSRTCHLGNLNTGVASPGSFYPSGGNYAGLQVASKDFRGFVNEANRSFSSGVDYRIPIIVAENNIKTVA